MGNLSSRIPASVQAYLPKLKTIESVYVRATPEQIEVMNRLAERDQARMQKLPDLEEVKRKDAPLESLLSRLNGTISGSSLDISDTKAVPQPLPPGGSRRPDSHLHSGPGSSRNASQPSSSATSPSTSAAAAAPASTASTSQPMFEPSPHAYGPRSTPTSRPAYHAVGEAAYVHARTPRNPLLEGTGPLELPEMRARRVVVDDEAGRAESAVLRAMFDERTKAGDAQQIMNLEAYTRVNKLDEEKLEQLMEFCCVPKIGEVPVFGHKYAYARPPVWWRREVSDATLKSEPFMWQKKIGMTSQGKEIPERQPKRAVKAEFSDAVEEARRNQVIRDERAAERAAKTVQIEKGLGAQPAQRMQF